MSPQFALPPDTRAIGTGNPPQDMNAVIDALTAMDATLNVLSAAYNGGADPTGGADSTAAFQSAINAAQPGQSVYAPAGTYLISSPLVIPPYIGLRGSPATNRIAGFNNAGTCLIASASFSAAGQPTAAVLLTVSADIGGYATNSEEQKISDLMITGVNLGGSTDVDAVSFWSGSGTVGRISLRNLLLYKMTGWGLSMPNGCGQIRARDVVCSMNGSNNANNAGGLQVHASDSRFMFCSGLSNYGDQWFIQNSFDSTFTDCHGENSSAGYNFHYLATFDNSGANAGGISFVNCSTDAGASHGWFLESTAPAAPPVSIIGGYVRAPGTGGTAAAYAVVGYQGPVNLVGCQSYPSGATSSPHYALQVTSAGATTNVTVTGGTLIGNNAFANLDGSAGLVTVSGDTTFGTGTGTGTATYTPGTALQAASSSELLPVDAVLFRQAGDCVATTHDRADVTGTFSPSSGIPYWHLVTLVAGVPVNAIVSWVTGTGKTGGSHGWAAIASVATGKIVAVSADQTDPATSWGFTSSAAPVALASPYIPPVTGAYWLGVSITATGMPALAVGPVPDTLIAAMPPILCGPSGSQSAPPSVGASGGPTSSAAADDIYLFAV